MKQGFTLIEFAIVLVIVALLVSGILAGQSLVEQAKLLKTVKFYKNLELSWRTFQTKYGTIPGDVKNPSMFFPACESDLWGPMQTVTGNGNGILDGGEAVCIWGQLNNSGLYHPYGLEANSITGNTPASTIDFTAGDDYIYAEWTPDINNFMYISDGEGYFLKGNIVIIRSKEANTDFVDVLRWNVGMSPMYVYTLDSKMDDGMPGNGSVIGDGVNTISYHNGMDSDTIDCYDNYELGYYGGGKPTAESRYKFSITTENPESVSEDDKFITTPNTENKFCNFVYIIN